MHLLFVAVVGLALAASACATTQGAAENQERVCQTYKVTGSRVPKTVCHPKR